MFYAYAPFSTATVGMLARLLLRKRLAVALGCDGSFGDLAVLRSLASSPLRLWLLRRYVDRFVALSEEIEQSLREIGIPSGRIVRIPNGVDAEHFRPAEPGQRAALRAELKLAGRHVALFVGRLAPQKGLEPLLDAWQAVRTTLPDALLVLVGKGPLREALRSRAGPGVRFAGLIRDPLSYLQAADCFVLPSRSEGMPSALLEAMATGLPCVATAIGGVVDVLRPGVEGWLVAPGDTSTLASALIDALSSAERQRLGAAARERVQRDFSLDSTADRLAQLYVCLATA